AGMARDRPTVMGSGLPLCSRLSAQQFPGRTRMKLRETLTLPLSAAGAMVMYDDPEYTAIRRSTLGSARAGSSVEGSPAGSFTVRTELSMPTDRVPDMVRPFVGSSVTIHETQSWSAPEADGGRQGTMTLEVAGTPARLTGSLRLRPGGEDSCSVEIDGDLVAKIPLLGARLEKAAMPYVSTVLRAEERSARTYMEEHAGCPRLPPRGGGAEAAAPRPEVRWSRRCPGTRVRPLPRRRRTTAAQGP